MAFSARWQTSRSRSRRTKRSPTIRIVAAGEDGMIDERMLVLMVMGGGVLALSFWRRHLIPALVLCGCVSESAWALLQMGGGFTPLLIGKVLLAQVVYVFLLDTFEGSAGFLGYSLYLGGVIGLVLMVIG